MKRKFFSVFAFLALLLCCVQCAFADVAINAANFPDALFRLVVAYLDVNSDGQLSNAEIANCTTLNLSGGGITTLEGIEYLTSLTYLSCYSNDLTELDVSKNTKLTELNCALNENLTSLKIGGNTNLVTLECWGDKISELDLSGCSSLKSLRAFTNGLKTLKLNGCTSLEEADLPNNQLTEFDASPFSKLKELDLRNNKLTALDVTNKTALTQLGCGNNNLTSLNIRNCTALERLNCYNNKLTELDLSSCTALAHLYCYRNELRTLDVSKLVVLEDLDCKNNHIEVLDTSALTKLKSLSFANNEISAIDVSNSPALYSLSAWKNRLTALDITKNPNLTFVAFAFNQVRTLDLSNNKKLEHLSCERNQFAALDLGGCTSLVSKGSDGWDYSVFEQQLVNPLTITRQTGEDISYPFVFNFSNYMQSSQFKNISADSVQGYDSDNQEIETVYSNGTARFAAEPAKVRYQYQTGFDNRYLNVTVSNSGEDYMTLSLNNHVYRIIFNLKDWNSAKEYCESLGGHLLTVTNEAEMQLILDMLTEADRITGSGIHYSEYWIGGFTGQENDNKKYTWPDNGDISPDTKLLLEYSEEYGIGTGDTETENSYYSPSEKFDFICEWEPVAANFAQYSDEYKRWLASRDENTFGEIPDAVDYSNLEGNPPDTTYEAEPPAKYDPRDLDFDFRVSDQGSYGTCWSFASIGALEASYIAQGFGSSAPDLSELHQAWFVFKDPRPSYAKPLFDTSETPLNQGGNNAMSIAFLSRIGPAAEADLPYAQAKNVESLTKGKYPENYSHPIRLKAAYELGAVNAANRTEVKQLIMKYGAIRIGYKTDSSAYRNDSYYAVGNGDGGHAVDIVGWDDNYSRLNFKNNPGKNGAWLCKNSWGTNWADKGFFWMSYEQYIYTSAVYIAANDEVQKVYGHDATAVIESLPHNWFTSIFRADSDENLNEVAFHTRNNNTSYEVYVNKYGANEPANPGVVQGSAAASGKLPYTGYHTVTLDKPVGVSKGEYFAVIVKLTPKVKGDYPTAVEDTGAIFSASSVTAAGKSYFANKTAAPVSADWQDGKRLTTAGTSRSCGASLKVFASVNGPAVITTSSLPTGYVNQEYSCTLNASGTKPITWTVTGLPAGLEHNNGVISGQPEQAGTSNVVIKALNSQGSDSKTLKLTISASSDPTDPTDPTDPNTPSGKGGGGGGGCNTGLGCIILISGLMFISAKIKRK